jgi:hypothetical protein
MITRLTIRGSEPGRSVAVPVIASRVRPEQQINCTAERAGSLSLGLGAPRIS